MHKCMQESSMELPMLSPKTSPRAGERMTKRLTIGEEQMILAKCFATDLLLKIRPVTFYRKLNSPKF